VAARAVVVDGAADVPAAHALPYDGDAWLADPSRQVRLEFIYARGVPQLTVRILNELPSGDGVTAVRIALATLEALEGTAVGGGGEAFKVNPPWRTTLLQRVWAAGVLLRTAAAAFWPFSPAVSAAAAAAPASAAAFRAYYRAPAPPLARFRLFRATAAPKDAYKALVGAVQAMHDRAGFRGFFNLINYSPRAAVSIVPRAAMLLDIGARISHSIVAPDFPPAGEPWRVINYMHADTVFVNNYGRHTHSFLSIPRAFVWDWTNMAASIAGVGCISVNGVFLAWTRWTPAGQTAHSELFEAALGAPIAEVEQMRRT
jgi:hypothetical protein